MALADGDDVAPDTTKQFVADRRTPRLTRDERPWSLDDLPVAVLILHDAEVVAVNERWTALTGLDLAASRGEGWLTAAHRRDRSAMRAFAVQAPGGDDTVADWRLTGPGGRGRLWVQARAHHVASTEPTALVLTFAETEAHPTTESKLLHLATHDALTGLLNRTAFIAEVEDALRRAAPAPTLSAVLFIDLDRFKEVNDRLGHQAGDTLLSVACRRIVSSLRPTESAGRLGGDEVAVLCPALTSRNSALRLAGRIVAAIEEPFTIHDEVVLIGASIGIAYSHSDSTAEELVNDADRAMYRAKAEGRSRYVVFSATDEPQLPYPPPADMDTSLAHVAVAVARGERQINDLWRHSVDLRNDPLAHRLARVSQALHAASVALSDAPEIG
jgi:diguanylate cyclase (GGDEF)-like protein